MRQQARPNFRTLAKAQAGLALSILSYVPLRLQNLTSLQFDVHIFVQPGAHAISSLEIPAAEVKNRTDLAFDIPRHIAKMLIEYRDRIAPRIIGHRPDRLFVNVDGSPKSPATVAWLIVQYAKRRAGITLTSASVPAPEREGPARCRAGQLRNRQASARPQEPQDHGRSLRRRG